MLPFTEEDAASVEPPTRWSRNHSIEGGPAGTRYLWCLPLPLPFEPSFPFPLLPELFWLELDGAVGTTAGDTSAPPTPKPGPAPPVAPPAAGGNEFAGGDDEGIRSGGAGAWCFGLWRFALLRDGLAAGFECGFGVGLAAGETECGVVTGWIA